MEKSDRETTRHNETELKYYGVTKEGILRHVYMRNGGGKPDVTPKGVEASSTLSGPCKEAPAPAC